KRRPRRLEAPERERPLERLGRAAPVLQRVSQRPALLVLRGDEIARVTAGPGQEEELEHQQRADVADVLDRLAQPRFDPLTACGRRLEDASRRTVLAGLVLRVADELERLQRLERPVHERPAERPDAADLAGGCERSREREPVRRSLVQEGQYGPL